MALTPNDRTHDVVYSVIHDNGKYYMDLTERLPYYSSRENDYALIAYHYDLNAIVGAPIKNR